MVKQLTINCRFHNGSVSPVKFYVGDSAKDSHPIQFQAEWLKDQYGASVSEDIMESMRQLKEVSENNRIKFEELCEYVFKEVREVKEINAMRQQSNNALKQIEKIDRVKQINEEENEE